MVLLAELLKPWDTLGKLYNLFDSRSETAGERLPDLLAGALGPWYRVRIQRTGLCGKTKENTLNLQLNSLNLLRLCLSLMCSLNIRKILYMVIRYKY